MYIRVIRGAFDPNRRDEVLALADDVVAAVSKLPGFHSYHGGINSDAGSHIIITTWQTEDAAHFAREALGEVIDRAQGAGLELEQPEFYEVLAPRIV
jgi:quinol monooxygenase YgiN